MPFTKAALLAPVLKLHLESGREMEGVVAFGCTETLALEEGADVFICATPCSDDYPSVSWRAIFVGYKHAVGGAHPDGMKFRPQSTKDEKWVTYYEVTDLKEFPASERIRVDKLISFATGKPYQPHVPYRPYLIRHPL